MVLVIVIHSVIKVPCWADLLGESEVDVAVTVRLHTSLEVGEHRDVGQIGLARRKSLYLICIGESWSTVLVGHFKLMQLHNTHTILNN